MKLTDSDDDLYKQLVDTEYAMPPPERQTAHWVMNKDWRDRIKAMRHASPGPMQHLLGKPVKITDDAGEPHLEVELPEWEREYLENLCTHCHGSGTEPKLPRVPAYVANAIVEAIETDTTFRMNFFPPRPDGTRNVAFACARAAIAAIRPFLTEDAWHETR